MDDQNIPELGETVVCKVKQVLAYGAFVELVEFDDQKGFVHVSQIASRWVKNIRNHVKEGQIKAAKVLMINSDRGQIDLSFNKVSGHAQRARIEQWKQLKRCKKLLEILAKEQKKDFDVVWEEVASPLLESFDTLGEAFQSIVLIGEDATTGVEKAWVTPLIELVKKNIPVPEKKIKGILSIRSLQSDGVDVIAAALKKAESKNVELFYSGGGKYSIVATAVDFKEAEKRMDKAVEMLSDEMKKTGGEVKFERIE